MTLLLLRPLAEYLDQFVKVPHQQLQQHNGITLLHRTSIKKWCVVMIKKWPCPTVMSLADITIPQEEVAGRYYFPLTMRDQSLPVFSPWIRMMSITQPLMSVCRVMWRTGYEESTHLSSYSRYYVASVCYMDDITERRKKNELRGLILCLCGATAAPSLLFKVDTYISVMILYMWFVSKPKTLDVGSQKQ